MKRDSHSKKKTVNSKEGEYQTSKIKSQCIGSSFQFFMVRLKNIANN